MKNMLCLVAFVLFAHCQADGDIPDLLGDKEIKILGFQTDIIPDAIVVIDRKEVYGVTAQHVPKVTREIEKVLEDFSQRDSAVKKELPTLLGTARSNGGGSIKSTAVSKGNKRAGATPTIIAQARALALLSNDLNAFKERLGSHVGVAYIDFEAGKIVHAVEDPSLDEIEARIAEVFGRKGKAARTEGIREILLDKASDSIHDADTLLERTQDCYTLTRIRERLSKFGVASLGSRGDVDGLLNALLMFYTIPMATEFNIFTGMSLKNVWVVKDTEEERVFAVERDNLRRFVKRVEGFSQQRSMNIQEGQNVTAFTANVRTILSNVSVTNFHDSMVALGIQFNNYTINAGTSIFQAAVESVPFIKRIGSMISSYFRKSSDEKKGDIGKNEKDNTFNDNDMKKLSSIGTRLTESMNNITARQDVLRRINVQDVKIQMAYEGFNAVKFQHAAEHSDEKCEIAVVDIKRHFTLQSEEMLFDEFDVQCYSYKHYID